mgnify:FL=1
MIAQTKEGKALLKDVEDALQNDALLKAGPAPENLVAAQERADVGKQKKADRLENLDETTKEIIRLRSENKSLRAEIMKDRTLLPINRPIMLENAARINELNARKEALQQSKEQ